MTGATKNRALGRGFSKVLLLFSTLAGFELALRLVDHVDAAFATHDAAVPVAGLERAERVPDLHGRLQFLRRGPAPGLRGSSV